MTRRRSSILARIGGLAVLIVLTVQAITVAVVLLTPPPSSPRMSPYDVRQALTDPAFARRMEWDRRVVGAAPFASSPGSGERTAAGLASALGLDKDLVRVRSGAPADGNTDVQLVTVRMRPNPVARTAAPTTAASAPQPGAMQAAVQDAVRRAIQDSLMADMTMLPEFTLPAFETAMRQADGRWVVIGPREAWLSSWQLRVLASLAMSLLVLAPLVWWAARRLTLPVRALASAAERDDPDVVFPDAGPREVVAMAQALTTMRRRLIQQSQERMRMLAAVAHDLRTPLTGLRIRAETAPPHERDRMAADIDRMEAMIADVLMASSARTVGGPAERIGLGPLCKAVVSDLDDGRGLLTLRTEDDIAVLASPMRVRRALTNLIDNALRYAGAAEISLVMRDGRASLTVADRGPGLGDDLAARAFEPFYRGETSRSRDTGGTGLGLTIARDLVQVDGGTLELAARPGGGTAATIGYALAPTDDKSSVATALKPTRGTRGPTVKPVGDE